MRRSSKLIASMLCIFLLISTIGITAFAATQTITSRRYGFSITLPDGWSGYPADQSEFGSMEIADGMTMEDMGLSLIAVAPDGGMMMLMQFRDANDTFSQLDRYLNSDPDMVLSILERMIPDSVAFDMDVDSHTNAQTTYAVLAAEIEQSGVSQQMVMTLGYANERVVVLFYVPGISGQLEQTKHDLEAILDTLVITEATFRFPSYTDLQQLGTQNLGDDDIDLDSLYSSDSNADTIWLIVGIVVGVLAIAAIIWGVMYSKRKKNQSSMQAAPTVMPDAPVSSTSPISPINPPIEQTNPMENETTASDTPEPSCTSAGSQRFCPQCGTAHEPGQAYCANCGAKL